MEASFKILRDQGKEELLEILDSLRGRKCLVLESSFKRLLLDTVFEGDQVLKDSNVHQYDINTPNMSSAFESNGRDMPDNVCYLIRPTFVLVKAVAKHIKDCVKAGK
jgi:hypothetical protein